MWDSPWGLARPLLGDIIAASLSKLVLKVVHKGLEAALLMVWIVQCVRV